ncbi:putative membrane protein [Nocardioides zeae]|uniref:Membrane protein n=1 Tax=Nocardioides zeae TaxID=1457234 RepID=A0ACC6IHQ0_9ACTN|nr:pilus assembly protein TadG-related protein [Nocardioides zeae]MDR6173154.1 putative membrane protein [Nocardioides zeae]MDR6210147.1 putative membrane protein [Nocardioides zeae]
MLARPGRAGRTARDERGAVALFVALSLALLLIITAFAVDLGMQRVARRDAQAIADLVSLDMARELDGRAKSAYSGAALDRAFEASVARNGDGLGAEPEDYSYELGRLDAAGAFASIGPSDPATAVKVTAVGSVGYLFTGGRGDVTRSAVSTADKSACIRIGSFIASLDSAQSALLNPLLSALFGSAVNLSAVSYQGLAGANVSLLDLVQVPGLGVGTVDELLELPAVRVADLFVASATVLDRQGKGVQADVLRALAATVSTPTVSVADLLGVQGTPQAALDASLNVLDLVTGTAYLVNDGRTVNVPNLGIGLPGAVVTSTKLTIVEPAQEACLNVGNEAETAQIKLELTARVDARTLSALGSTVSMDATDLHLSIDLGQAVARLLDVQCNANGPDKVLLQVRSAVVGSIDLSASTRLSASIGVPLGNSLLTPILGFLGLGSVLGLPTLELDAPVSIAGRSTAGGFDKPVTLTLPASYDIPQGSGSGVLLTVPSVSVSSATTLRLRYSTLLGGAQVRAVLRTDPLFTDVVNPVLSSLTGSVLSPLVTSLQNALVLPLAELLGLQLGGADVFAKRTPTCNAPRLRQ